MPQLSASSLRIRPGVFAQLQAKIDARQREGLTILPLHIGDTCVPPPKEAALGAITFSDAEAYRYGPTAGLPLLRDAIVRRLARAHGRTGVDAAAEVHVGVGGTHALFTAARAVLGEGDEVILATPYWPLAPGVFAAAGARTVEANLSTVALREGTVDIRARLLEKLTPQTRALYFGSPNNPDGKLWSEAELAAFVAFAEEHDLWLFADEVYADIVYQGRYVPTATLPGALARTITIHSLSKSHALAGYRIGYVVAPAEVVAQARRVSTHAGFNVPVVLQKAAAAALDHGDAWSLAARETYRSARRASMERLDAHRLPFVTGEGGTYHFLDCASLVGAGSLTELLARALDAGVLLAPGDAFGADYGSWARICFTSAPIADVLDGIDRIASLR